METLTPVPNSNDSGGHILHEGEQVVRKAKNILYFTSGEQDTLLKEKTSGFANTSKFSDDVYNNLPEHIRTLTTYFEGRGRQKDIFLFSLLHVLSACMPKVSGLYFEKRLSPEKIINSLDTGTFETKWLVAEFAKHGISRRTVCRVITQMVAKGRIRKVSFGVYEKLA